MASIRQDYLGNYSQQNQNVGIGTSIPKEKLEIHGGITAQQDLNVTGIATLTVASGFIKRNLEYSEDVYISSGDSATLSGEIIVGSGLTMSVGTGATAGQGNIDSLKVYDMFQPPTGGTNQRPVGKPGSLFYNTDFKTIEFFDGNSWRQVDNTTTRGRAVFAGGYTPSLSTLMDFVNIHSLGNANNFGDLNHGGASKGSMGSDGTRGLFMGGYWPAAPTVTDQIDYITIAVGGNGIDFGDLTNSNAWGGKGASSSTRGIRMGGYPNTDTIDYVEINTLGNALDFGNLTASKHSIGVLASPTKIFGGGGNASSTNYSTIETVTTSSKGNAIDDGDLGHELTMVGAASNSVRGIWAGGGPLNLSDIQYRTLSSSGNTRYFGDLTIGKRDLSGASTQTRAIFGGGRTPTIINSIDFVTMASTGSANDFGDLSEPRRSTGALSDSHGGLGGF